MNAKEKIEELLEASEDGTITASGAACMCGAAHGRTIFTSCSASMGAGFTRTIPPCICWAIQTVPRRNIR